jgi:hypothetical protein
LSTVDGADDARPALHAVAIAAVDHLIEPRNCGLRGSRTVPINHRVSQMFDFDFAIEHRFVPSAGAFLGPDATIAIKSRAIGRSWLIDCFCCDIAAESVAQDHRFAICNAIRSERCKALPPRDPRLRDRGCDDERLTPIAKAAGRVDFSNCLFRSSRATRVSEGTTGTADAPRQSGSLCRFNRRYIAKVDHPLSLDLSP